MNKEDARELGKVMVIGSNTAMDRAVAAANAGHLITNTETGAQRLATPEEIEGHYLAGVGAGGSIRPLSGAEKKRHAKAEARIIAGVDYSTPIDVESVVGGHQARAVEGSRYVSWPGEAFVRRRFPKVKGKAAAKLAKKQRHAERAEADRRDPARNVDGI